MRLGEIMKKTFFIAVLSIAMLVAFSATAFADSTTTTTTGASGVQDKLAATKAKACTKIKARVEKAQTKLGKRIDKAEEIFKNQDDRLQTLATKAQARNIDVTKLQSDMKTWQGYTTSIQTTRSEIVEQVQSGVTQTCSGDAIGGASAFTAAKSKIEDIQKIRQDRRDYWEDTIIPDLKDIKSQAKAQVTNKVSDITAGK